MSEQSHAKHNPANTYYVQQVSEAPTCTDGIIQPESIDWSVANTGTIAEINWPSFSLYDKTITQRVSPISRFYLLYNQENLFCLLTTAGEEEKHPRAQAKNFQDPVHLDSCLEFFLSAEKTDRLYLNIETNARGTKHVGCGRGRKEGLFPNTNARHRLSVEEARGLYMQPVQPAQIKQLAQTDQPTQCAQATPLDFDWGVYIQIPLAFLAQFWPSVFNDDAVQSLSSGSSAGPSKVTQLSFYKGQILKANFYKCGDLCRSPHFLSWQAIQSPQPDFHRPEDFGYLILN